MTIPTSPVAQLLDAMARHGQADAMVWRGQTWSYTRLTDRVEAWRGALDQGGMGPGTVCTLEGDYSPEACAVLLALLSRDCIAAPMPLLGEAEAGARRAITQAEVVFRSGRDGMPAWSRTGQIASHPLYAAVRTSGHPGVVLFSSGSTGPGKAAVHDAVRLLARFRREGHRWRTLAFLLLDHIGGLNTLFYTLRSGGCLVFAPDRQPETVMALVAAHRVELLPVSPTFLTLMLMSEAHLRHDVSSLRAISYGTEPMPESTLARLRKALPNVRLIQTYGTTELGILPTRSRGSESLWMKIGDGQLQTRVVHGILHVRSHSTMLGYLNAPQPFTEDGWLDTGDEVAVDGDYVRVLGRRQDTINVGGRKVHPAEVESVLLACENVEDARVFAEPNALLGQVVAADVRPARAEDPLALSARVKEACRRQMPDYKVPMRVRLCAGPLHSERFKKARRRAP